MLRSWLESRATTRFRGEYFIYTTAAQRLSVGNWQARLLSGARYAWHGGGHLQRARFQAYGSEHRQP